MESVVTLTFWNQFMYAAIGGTIASLIINMLFWR